MVHYFQEVDNKPAEEHSEQQQGPEAKSFVKIFSQDCVYQWKPCTLRNVVWKQEAVKLIGVESEQKLLIVEPTDVMNLNYVDFQELDAIHKPWK